MSIKQNIIIVDFSEKVKQSLKFIYDLYSHDLDNVVAFSGGKDSIVLYHLCKSTGLKFNYVYIPLGSLGYK